MTKIDIKPEQYKRIYYEFQCHCGHIWIDSKNTGCPICSEIYDVTAEIYEIPQPKNFDRK